MDDTLRLPDELTIYTVADWRVQALAWLDRPADAETLRIDASGVADIDGAGTQALVALANALERRGRRLGIEGASAPLVRACTAIGAAFLLGEEAAA